MTRNRIFIYSGYLIPLVFWSTIILCGLLTGNYNHLTDLVSELGATGTKAQYIFTTGLILSSALSILFVAGIYTIAKRTGLSPVPVLFILTFSFSISGAAIFPLPSALHGILGSPSVLLPLSPLLALILWEEQKISKIKIASGIVLLIMLLGFSAFFPDIMGNYPGLKQRFFHIGWTLWFICLSQRFSELDKKQLKKPTASKANPINPETLSAHEILQLKQTTTKIAG